MSEVQLYSPMLFLRVIRFPECGIYLCNNCISGLALQEVLKKPVKKNSLTRYVNMPLCFVAI